MQIEHIFAKLYEVQNSSYACKRSQFYLLKQCTEIRRICMCKVIKTVLFKIRIVFDNDVVQQKKFKNCGSKFSK